MSNYLGLADQVPAFQPFDPSLNFYANVLSTKQSAYDQGLAKVSSIYNSALNSPLVREDNLTRRDKYFQTIETDLKKVAGMDLSIDQNTSAAKRIFDPILNDRYILKDMAFSRGLQNAHKTAERYRGCIDPDACGGSYWEEGVQALNYAQEEFQRATPDDSLRYQAPTYTPYQNVTKKAIKAAKDSGFNVSYDHTEGRYLVTDTNGQLLLGQDGKGILPQYLYGLFGNDPAVQKMYQTQAYVQRKNFAKANAGRYGGNEDAAESEYLNTVLQQTIPRIEASQRDLAGLRNRADTDIKALQVLANTNGGAIPGDGIDDAYGQLLDLVQKTDSSEQYHQQVSNLINSAPNLNDIKALRSRVDGIVANANFMDTINTAAYDYAMGTSKREIKADPYALASYNNSLDIQKGIALQNHEFGIWQEKEKISFANKQTTLKGSLGMSGSDARNINQYLISKGITAEKLKKENLPLDVSQWTKEDFDKVKKGGLGQDVAGKITEVTTLAGGEVIEDPYIANSRLMIESVNNMKASSANYLKESFDTMKNQFLNPVGNNEDEKKAVRDKIWANMNTILDGTGISPQSILDGTTKTDVFNNQITRFGRAIGRAVTLQEKDVASQVITNQWSPAALAKYQVDKQVAEGFYSRKKADNKAAIDNMKAELFANMDLSMEATLDPSRLIPADKQEKMINAIANDEGLVYKQTARNRYIQAAQNLYEKEPSRIVGMAAKEVKGKTAAEKAGEDFDRNYDQLITKYTQNLPNWKSAAGSSDRGGALAVRNAMEFQVRGEERFSPAFMQIERIATEAPRSTNLTYFEPTVTNLADIEQSEGKKLVADRLFESIRNSDTKDLDFTYKLRNQPRAGVDGNIMAQGAFLDVNMTDATVRKLFPNLDKDDDLTPYKNFSVRVPAGSVNTVDQFIRGTTPNNIDVYMLQNGTTLNQNLPGLGSYNITRQGQSMVFTGKFKGINPLNGSEQDIEFEPQNLGEVSPERAIEIGNSLLQQAGVFKANAKKELTTKAQQDARTRGNR